MSSRQALDAFREAHFNWYRAMTQGFEVATVARLAAILAEKKRAFDASVSG